MHEYWMALLGGVLIGVASLIVLASQGRVAGISGLLAAVLRHRQRAGWRVWFVAGLVAGGVALALIAPSSLMAEIDVTWPVVAAGGLLVGFGTQLGGGCTSGHGVCGIGRFDLRSLLATIVFMAGGAGTVFVVRHLIGGGA